MISNETLRYEIAGRLDELEAELGKVHLSVRWEPGPRIARVGACIEAFDWENRMAVIATLLEFEQAHADELALEFDVIPLDAVNDERFVEA